MSADQSVRPSEVRTSPSVGVAVAVFVLYVAVFIGLTSTSSASFEDFFATADDVWRSAVLPLAAGAVVLAAFLAWARWDHVVRDPQRLWMSRSLRIPLVLFAVTVVARLALADWGQVGIDLLVPIVLAGILVGFAEGTLFRGVALRALRSAGRSETAVVVISSLVRALPRQQRPQRGVAGCRARPERPGDPGGGRAVPVPPQQRLARPRDRRSCPVGHLGVPPPTQTGETVGLLPQIATVIAAALALRSIADGSADADTAPAATS